MNKITLEKVFVSLITGILSLAVLFFCDLIIGGLIYLFCSIVWDTLFALDVFRVIVFSLLVIEVVFIIIALINSLRERKNESGT